MAYSNLYNLTTKELRFFTVHSSLGRPDMAMFLAKDAMVNGKPFNVFKNELIRRHFTYINDIVKGGRLLQKDIRARINLKKKYIIHFTGDNNSVKPLEFI
ncbi:MAG: hypothetical protein RIM68_07540 [Arenibacter sp.]